MLWQIVVGPMLGVLAGIVLGCVCYYAYFRCIEKSEVSLRAVFSALFGGAPMLAAGDRHHTSRSAWRRGRRVVTGTVTLAGQGSHEVSFQRRAELPRTRAPAAAQAVFRWPDTINPAPAAVAEQQRPAVPVLDGGGEKVLPLLWEFERNRKAIREFSGDELVPLRTDAWDLSQPVVRSLPHEVQTDLENIYTDIGLLNHLAWLSSEFNRNSPTLRSQYVNLSRHIADRLDRLIRVSISHFATAEPVPALFA